MPVIFNWEGEIAALHVRMQRSLYDDVQEMLEILAANIDQSLIALAEKELEEALIDDLDDYGDEPCEVCAHYECHCNWPWVFLNVDPAEASVGDDPSMYKGITGQIREVKDDISVVDFGLIDEFMEVESRFLSPMPLPFEDGDDLFIASKCQCEACRKEGNKRCYGKLWECEICHKMVCSGAGQDDDMPNACTDCWVEAHCGTRRDNES